MIIGFDGSRAFGNKRTGTENYSYNLLKALSKIDNKNNYVIFVRPGVTLEKFPDNFKFLILNFKFLWTQGGLATQTFKQKLDVLFVPAHTLPIIRKPGLKTVITVHDLGSEYLPQMHQLKQRVYLSYMQRHQLNSATKIIAVSKATEEDLVKRVDLDPEKIEVVHEGYDKDLFKSDVLVNSLISYSRRDQGSERSEGSYFLFVGTIQPRKNLERVIKAFAIHLRGEEMQLHLGGEPKLIIIGGKGWMSDEIYKLPKKLGIESRVKFLGYVPDEKLPALYSNAEALVFPSLFEGFGLPILEAQACGCPVITSGVGSSPKNLSSMPEVAGKGAILVDPYSVDGIADAMIRVKGKAERGKLIKAGFDNIKRFSWEKCARETLKVLESV